MRKLIALFILLNSFPLLADFDDKCSVLITLRFQTNEDAYQDGWCMIVKPHEWDDDMHLNEQEYIEYLNEI